MTPAATTPAGRKAAPQHRRTRTPTRPSPPRRVSGPVTGRAATAPAAPLRRRSTRPAGLARGATVGVRVGTFIRRLPDHVLLDRLIRGRWWIPMLGLMLAGIVAMQVEVLKLGASIGRSLEQNSVLSSRNASLRESVATLADDQRIEQLAGSMGMVMPPPSAVGFLPARNGSNAGAVIANIHQPSASSFMALTTGNGAVVTATSLADANGSSSATGTASTIPSTPTPTPTSDATAASAATVPTAAAPTVPSSDTAAAASGATPTPTAPVPTLAGSTPSSTQVAPGPPSSPSTGAAAIAPPTSSSGGG